MYGSRAYLPEEFFTGGFQFNIKTDTYSFGIVSLKDYKIIFNNLIFLQFHFTFAFLYAVIYIATIANVLIATMYIAIQLLPLFIAMVSITTINTATVTSATLIVASLIADANRTSVSNII